MAAPFCPKGISVSEGICVTSGGLDMSCELNTSQVSFQAPCCSVTAPARELGWLSECRIPGDMTDYVCNLSDEDNCEKVVQEETSE